MSAHNRIYRTRLAREQDGRAGRSSKEIAVIRVGPVVPVIFAYATRCLGQPS